MPIEDILEATRPDLSMLNLSDSILPLSSNIDIVRGFIAEMFVYTWLSRTEGVMLYSADKQVGSTRFVPKGISNVVAVENEKSIHEFDLLAGYEEEAYAVEVKSARLNGFCAKIERSVTLATKFFDKPAKILLFYPLAKVKRHGIVKLMESYPSVTLIDMGYKRKDLYDIAIDFSEKIKALNILRPEYV